MSNKFKLSLNGATSKKRFTREFTITAPSNMVHKTHVDMEYNWVNVDPSIAFQTIAKLGEGAYGSVYKAKHIETNYVLAVKVVLVGKTSAEELKKEIDILKKCRHKNIVSMYGCLMKDNYLWIMMDFCGLGSVTDFLKRYNEPLTANEIIAIIYFVLHGLKYLHSMNIIHRDLKSGNILLNIQGEIKIADFGVSAQLGALNKANTIIGTPLFMSPEVLNGEKYDFSADIWSLGITIIEMSDGNPPHSKENLMRSMMLIASGPPPTLQTPSQWPDLYNKLLAQCVQKDPPQRPKSSDLLNHEIFAERDQRMVIFELISKYRLKLPDEQLDETENLMGSSPTSLASYASNPSLQVTSKQSRPTLSNNASLDEVGRKDSLSSSYVISSPKNFQSKSDSPLIAELKNELLQLKNSLTEYKKMRKTYEDMKETLREEQIKQTQFREQLEEKTREPLETELLSLSFSEIVATWRSLRKNIADANRLLGKNP